MSERIHRPVLVGRLPEAKLKTRTGQVLQAIADYWSAKNIPPSYREIAEATGISLTATRYQVGLLLKCGCLERPVASTTRSLRITSEGWRQLKRAAADKVENHCEAAVLGPTPGLTKAERVRAWADTQVGRPVMARDGGPWYPSYHHPERDQVVLGFLNETRMGVLLRHKWAGVYDVLRPGEAWFDDPPDRALQIMEPTPDAWRAIPEEVLNG